MSLARKIAIGIGVLLAVAWILWAAALLILNARMS